MRLEDVSYCPKCGQPGKVVMEKPAPKGGKLYTLHCQNEICPWLDSGWAVQTMSDGTVYERQPGPKQFEALTSTDKRIAEKVIRQVLNGEEIKRGN